MNPIARLSVDPPSEPRGETPAPGAVGDVDPTAFSLALAAAAHSQAASAPPATQVAHPGPEPAGGPRDSEGTSPPVAPASPSGSEGKTPLPRPLVARGTQAGPALDDATPKPAGPAPGHSEARPAGAARNEDEPATPVAAAVASASRDASSRLADLPLTVRVLELVRDMTEQAARMALDTALSAGTSQDVSLGAVPRSDRSRGVPRQAGDAPVAVDGSPRPAPAALVLAARTGSGGRERGRSAARVPVQQKSDDAAARGDGTARGAAPRTSLVNESVAAFPVPLASAPQAVRPQAGSGSADPAAGGARASATPAESRAAPRSGDQVTLHFTGEDGLEGKLRVAVRGQNVRATILSDDPVTVERLARGLGDLQRSLLERGFPEARLNVQHAVRSEAPASGAPAREHAREDPHPRGEGRDRNPSSRQERESTSTEEQPRRRPSRPRTER